MDELIRKISNIQNKQKTLRWGHDMCGEHECLFVVGNTAYPGQVQCFTVTEEFVISIVDNSHKKAKHDVCSDVNSVASCVIQLLKKWFPAKTLENT
jgi:hypothetical protein